MVVSALRELCQEPCRAWYLFRKPSGEASIRLGPETLPVRAREQARDLGFRSSPWDYISPLIINIHPLPAGLSSVHLF